MNSISGLCLHFKDVALKLNLPFDMCRWLVAREDVEVVQEVLVRYHGLLTSWPLLRPSGLQQLPLHRLAQLGDSEVRVTSRYSCPIILLRSQGGRSDGGRTLVHAGREGVGGYGDFLRHDQDQTSCILTRGRAPSVVELVVDL